MKIQFCSLSPVEAVKKIEKKISGRKLGAMVSFQLDNEQLIVKISKLGSSRLFFDVENKSGDTVLELASEKIALSHKAMKASVLEKLVAVIESCDGKILRKYGG